HFLDGHLAIDETTKYAQGSGIFFHLLGARFLRLRQLDTTPLSARIGHSLDLPPGGVRGDIQAGWKLIPFPRSRYLETTHGQMDRGHAIAIGDRHQPTIDLHILWPVKLRSWQGNARWMFKLPVLS